MRFYENLFSVKLGRNAVHLLEVFFGRHIHFGETVNSGKLFCVLKCLGTFLRRNVAEKKTFSDTSQNGKKWHAAVGSFFRPSHTLWRNCEHLNFFFVKALTFKKISYSIPWETLLRFKMSWYVFGKEWWRKENILRDL